MLFKTIIIAGAAAAATVSADLAPRDLASCTSIAAQYSDVLAGLPTPTDASLVAFIAQQTQLATATDPCVVPAVTGSLADDYTSWAKQLATWQQEHKTELSSLLAACTDVPLFQEQLSSLGPAAATVCDKITFETAAAGAADADASDTDNAAAPRETGMVVAAAAVAGMAGMVVAGMY